MVPAFIVVGAGVNATKALVISQVVLSIALPLPMITLIMFTRRSDIMGEFANSKVVSIVAVAGTVIVLALNLLLIVQTLGSAFPG
jgi:manganese transport protein